MRALILCAGLSLVLTAPVLAQQPGGSQQQTPGQQTQQPAGPQSGQVLAKIRQNLQAAGFTDIRMMPTSFMIRAKDKDGNPVMMLVNPDSIEAITFEGGGNSPASTTGQGTANPPQANPGQSNKPQ
jgi:hypothetical protein